MDFRFLVGTLNQMKDALATVSFDSWYGFVVSFASALASEFLFSLVRQFIRSRRKKASTQDQKQSSWLEIAMYILGYALFLMLAVVCYVLIHHSVDLGNGAMVFDKTLSALWAKYKHELIVLPIVVTVAKRMDRRCSQRIRLLVIVFLIFALALSPLLVTHPSHHTALEPLLLSEFKGMPYPFVTRFYDPDGLARFVAEGYVGGDDGDEPNGDGEGRDELLELPTEDPRDMDFLSLMRAARICSQLGETDRQRIYVDAAYALYEKDRAVDEAGNPAWGEIGRMWFYKGSLDDNPEFYYRAGDVYESVEDYGNAVICYIPAYLGNPNDAYAEKAISAFIRDNPDNVSRQIDDFVILLQARHAGSIPYMDEMRQRYPDDMAIQLVMIMRDIQEGHFAQDDVETARRFAADPKYFWCPKLAIIEAYWGIEDGVDCEGIYDRYMNYEWIFEPEDRANLAWMLYMSGEYGKAYSVIASATVNRDGDNGIIPDVYYLAAELCMQDSMLHIDESWLMEHMRRETDLSWYDENSRIRMNVVGVLLANRLGKSADYGFLGDSLGSLFDGATFSERMILATADYECGNYRSCVMRCREMQSSDIPEESTHRLLFLKADALMAYANEVDDRQARMELLQEAETDMNAVREAVEDDYIECLKKLSNIYDNMGDRQDDKIIIDDILAALPVKM